MRKKDALESAHRDEQRIVPVVGFQHRSTVRPQSANWWALHAAQARGRGKKRYGAMRVAWISTPFWRSVKELMRPLASRTKRIWAATTL